MYPAALHKYPTLTVSSSQILAKYIRQKQPQLTKSITRNWDKKVKILNKFVPNKTTISFQSFDRQRQFYPNWYFPWDQASGFERSKIKNECYQKTFINSKKNQLVAPAKKNTDRKLTTLNVAWPILLRRLLFFGRCEVLIFVEKDN